MTALPIRTARLMRALPLCTVAGFGAYGLVAAAGAVGVLLLVSMVVFGAGLAGWTRASDDATRRVVARTATAVVLCGPGGLVLFFSFSSGGFFPDSVAIGDLGLAAALVIRLAVAERPVWSFDRRSMLPLAGLAGLSGWALLSQLWSHAPGRAAIAFDRDLLYLLTFALFASVGRTRERLAWATRMVALAMVAVAAVALVSAVAPDVLAVSTAAQAGGARLAYPLTYWNALGIFCAVAAVLCFHLACADDRGPVRVTAAGALPVIGATILLTYSRGGLLVAVGALVLYALLGRPRGLLSATISAAPGTALAIWSAYDSTLLSSADPISPAAIRQGHHLAFIVVLCVVLSVALRLALLLVDRRLEADQSVLDRYYRELRGAALAVLGAGVIAAAALGVPSAIAHRWDQFVNQQTAQTGPLLRSRLASGSSSGRVALWTVAYNEFRAHPIDGSGAETFEIAWFEDRPHTQVVVNAHSMYLETMAELGLVGIALLALFVFGALAGLFPRRPRHERVLYAALFSAALAWFVHAGVDWDWQMPATSLGIVALAGLALGRSAEGLGPRPLPDRWIAPLVVGLAVVAVAVLPGFVLASQVRLNDATSAFAAGNCSQADALARSSIDVLGTRAPPWQIEAMCAARVDHFVAAETYLRRGLAQDPDDWQLQSALAAAEAVRGSDAAAAQADSAEKLNPLDGSIREMAKALAGGPSAAARRAGISFLDQQTLIASG